MKKDIPYTLCALLFLLGIEAVSAYKTTSKKKANIKKQDQMNSYLIEPEELATNPSTKVIQKQDQINFYPSKEQDLDTNSSTEVEEKQDQINSYLIKQEELATSPSSEVIQEQDQINFYPSEEQDLDTNSSTEVEEKQDQAEMTYEERINIQRELLNSNEFGGKNYQELQVLTEKGGIAITQESLKDLRTNFNFSVIKVDLAEPENLRHALLSALDFSLKNDSENNFVMGSNALLSKIKNSGSVRKAIAKLQDFLRSMDVSSLDDQARVSDLLQAILDELDSAGMGVNNPFGRFISGILKVYQTESARRAADEIMLKLRPAVEQALHTNVSTTSASFGVQGNVNGVNIGGSIGASNTGQSLFSNFYAISKTKKVEFKIGAGLFQKLLNLSASVGAEATSMAVYNSIEQLLDSGKVIPTLQFAAVEEMAKSRLRMQRQERKQLAIFRDNVEGYYKMMGVVPISTYVEWPKITRASEAAQVKILGANIGGSASSAALAGLGITVKVSKSKMNAISSKGYLTLLNPDCSSAVSTDDPNYPLKFIGVEYDYSSRYMSIANTIGGDYDDSCSFKIGISEAVEKGSPVHEAFEVAVNTILGDLRRYNDIIASIAEITDEIDELNEKVGPLYKISLKRNAEKNETKEDIQKLEKELGELEKSKHEFEGRWKKANASREGREGVLKSMIATLSNLKQLAGSQISDSKSLGMARVNELFEQCYAELQRLTQLHEFSKSKSKRKAAAAVVGDTKYILAETYVLSLPGGASATLVHNHGKIPDWDITVSIPTTVGGIIAKELILTKLKRISEKLGEDPSRDADKDMVNVLQTAGTVLSNQLANIPSVPLPSGATSVGYSGNTTVNIALKELAPSGSELISLPSQELVELSRKKCSVMYTQIQTTSNFNVGAKINAGVAAVNASISQAIGKKIWLGGDLYFWSGKYNAFAAGLKDKTSATKVNTPWETLATNQANQLKKLFGKIGKADEKITFELQELYNNARNKAKNDSKKIKALESSYINLIQSCRKDPNSAKNYKKCLDDFNEVLKINNQSLAW